MTFPITITINPGWEMWCAGFATALAIISIIMLVVSWLIRRHTPIHIIRAEVSQIIENALADLASPQRDSMVFDVAGAKLAKYKRRLGNRLHGGISALIASAATLARDGEISRARGKLIKAIELIYGAEPFFPTDIHD